MIKSLTKPVHFLIIEAYTDANIGSGALVENTVAILRERFPNAELRVMAHYPQAFFELCRVDAVEDIFHYPFGKTRLTQAVWLLQTLAWMSIVFIQSIILPRGKILFLRTKVRDYLWADIVVSVGAERINDKYIKNILFSLYTYALVPRLGRSMVLFPCTIGPFLFKLTRWLTAKALKHVGLVYTRDNLSFKNTCELKGIDKKKVVNTSDVAVYQKQADRKRSLDMIGAEKNDRIVGISVMRWSYVANTKNTVYSNYESYVKEVAKLADILVKHYGVTIIFYPTNFPVRGCREDDVNTAREIKLKMRHKARSRIIETLPSPADFKGMLACSEVNITTRMHAYCLQGRMSQPYLSTIFLNCGNICPLWD